MNFRGLPWRVQWLRFHDCPAKGSIAGWGTKIPQATWRGQNKLRISRWGQSPRLPWTGNLGGLHRWPLWSWPWTQNLECVSRCVVFWKRGPQLSRSWLDKVKNQCLWGWAKVLASFHRLFSPCGQAVRYTGWAGGGRGGPGDREKWRVRDGV